MKTEVVVAMISSITTILIAVYTYFTRKSQDKNIEILKSQLQDKLLEKDAMRDYQYEVRKRLYSEYEPLLFQFIEHSEASLARIENLARASRENNLGQKGWMFNEYYFISTVYRLLSPLVIYRMMIDKLTLFDFKLDRRINVQYNLIKILFYSYTDDFEIARCGEYSYRPFDVDWKVLREKDEVKYWRQGIPTGKLEKSIEALIITENGKKRVMHFGEFESNYNSSDKFKDSFEVITDILFNFQPENRIILWNILIIQALIYKVFVKIGHDKEFDNSKLLDVIFCLSKDEKERLFWFENGNSEFEDLYIISQKYINKKLQVYII